MNLSEAEPTASAMVNMKLLAPGNKASADRFFATFSKNAFLRVFICLTPTEEVSGEDDKGTASEEKKKKPRPVPIGYLVMWSRGGSEALHHRAADMGFALGPEYRGKGYGSEAINWAVDWGFLRAGLHRVGLQAFGCNPAALRLYKKLGFVEEGREREALLFERKWYDVYSMGMLEHEWEKLRGLAE